MKGIHLTEHMTAVAIVNTATPFTGLEVWLKIKVLCPIVPNKFSFIYTGTVIFLKVLISFIKIAL